jgi:hypothetical protein
VKYAAKGATTATAGVVGPDPAAMLAWVKTFAR